MCDRSLIFSREIIACEKLKSNVKMRNIWWPTAATQIYNIIIILDDRKIFGIAHTTKIYQQYSEYIFGVDIFVLSTHKYTLYAEKAEIFSVRRNILSTHKYTQYAGSSQYAEFISRLPMQQFQL